MNKRFKIIKQDNEIVAFLSKNDVCGNSKWKDSHIGKSVVHVRALTYCDIHTINVDDLKTVKMYIGKFSLICIYNRYSISINPSLRHFPETLSCQLTLQGELYFLR